MATQYNAGLSAGQVLTAATMNSIGAAWETWTPALTASTSNPTLGTGSSQTGRWGRIQKVVVGQGKIKFGTAGTAAGSGTYFVSLPTAAQAATGGPIGTVFIFDGGLTTRVGVLIMSTTTTCSIRYDAGALVTNAAPWAWGTDDEINYEFTYEAA